MLPLEAHQEPEQHGNAKLLKERRISHARGLLKDKEQGRATACASLGAFPKES